MVLMPQNSFVTRIWKSLELGLEKLLNAVVRV